MNEKSGPATPPGPEDAPASFARHANAASGLQAEELRGQVLRGQDLTKVEGLLPEHLARADLTRAKLSEEIAKFPALEQVKAICAEARKIFIGLPAACVYCWLVIARPRMSPSSWTPRARRCRSSTPRFRSPASTSLAGRSSPRSTATFTSTCSGCGGRSRPCPRSSRTAWPSTTRPTPGCSLASVARTSRGFATTRVRSRFWRMLTIVLAWWLTPVTLVALWKHFLHSHYVVGLIWLAFLIAASTFFGRHTFRLARQSRRSTRAAAIDRGLIDVDPIEGSGGGGGGWESG